MLKAKIKEKVVYPFEGSNKERNGIISREKDNS